jgi:hypothetical protein
VLSNQKTIGDTGIQGRTGRDTGRVTTHRPEEQVELSDVRDEEEYEETPFFNEFFDEYAPDDNHVSDADQEVGVSINGAGNLVPIRDQLGDYHKRGPELNDVCVWDFIAHVDKVSKTSDRRKHQEKCSEDADSTEPMRT